MERHTIQILLVIALIIAVPHPGYGQSVRQDKEVRARNDAEVEAYKLWYEALSKRQLDRVIDLGRAYLQSMPNGQYAGFIKRVVEFARVSLDPDHIARAKNLRLAVRASLEPNKNELNALANKILAGQIEPTTTAIAGQSPLVFACSNGDEDSVRALLRKDVHVNDRENIHGWTPLVYAVWSGNTFVTRVLLDYDADTTVKDKDGWTAFAHATATADFEMMLAMRARH